MHFHRSSAPASARLGALALAAALACALPSQAQTSDPSAQSYDLPAQPLGSALARIASQSSQQISVPAELVRGLQAPAVRGSLSAEQAARAALAGSGLELVRTERGNWSVQPAPARAPAAGASSAAGGTLAAVTVTAEAERSGTTDGTGSYTQQGPSNTATGLALSLRETPQSVSVMTRQRMDDFQLETLTDVLEQAPGVTVDRQGDAHHFMVRGSAVNMQVNGMRQIAAGWAVNAQKFYSMDDMVEIDRIEVLKGSSGLMNGDGNYGATVNMVRKRPTHDFQASVGAGLGSWNSYRADVDLGGPLNASGTVRGRLVAAAADSKDFRDYVKRSNQTLFGTVDVDLAPDTLLNVDMTYRHREYQGTGETAMIQAYNANGQYLGLKPRSFNMGAPWSGFEQDTLALSARLEHRFGNGWTAKLQASHEKTDNPYYETGVWWTVVPQAIDVAWTRDHYNRNHGIALDLQGPFALFGRTHELRVGADSGRAKTRSIAGSARLSDLGLDFDQGGGAIVRPDLASLPENNDSTFSSSRQSLHAAGRFSLADPVKLIAGARITNFRQHDTTPYASSNKDFRKNGVITPYAGLVVDVHENVSLYGSYASIFKPQSAADASGQTLDPEEGSTYELGAKGEFFGKRLNASIAHFWMKTDNVAESTGQSRPDGTAIYRAVSGVQRRGYELELSGELARGWQAQGGFVMNSSSLDSTGYLPKHQFKLGTTYQMAGALQGLTVGAAGRWQSTTSAGALEQPAFWVVDLMARYRVDRHLSLSLNVRNAFDKSYFAGMRDFGRIQYTWGAPRSVNLGVRYTF